MHVARTASRFTATAVMAVLVLGLTAGSVTAAPGVSRAADQGPLGWRREVLHLVNDARREAHVAPFRINRDLSRNALSHTRRMVAERRVFRTSNVDDLVEPYGATLWAEELARGTSLEANIRAWMNHADTRRHLLDPRMRHAAIGVQFAHGRYWVTVYLHN